MDNKEEVQETKQSVNSSLKVGDIIQLGVYPQGEHGEVQPIDWIIVGLQDNIATIVSKYILDSRAYNDNCYTNQWKECTLRKWLNFDFYHQSKLDEAPLILTHLEDAEDPLFVLSKEEASDYFSKKDRAAKGTPYAINSYLLVAETDKYKDYGYYWLRTKSHYSNYHHYVFWNGDILPSGPYITSQKIGIRPAARVLIDLL